MAFAKPLSSGNPIGVGIRENIRGQGQQDPINRAARHLKEQNQTLPQDIFLEKKSSKYLLNSFFV